MFREWTESYEQVCLVQWLENNNYKFTSVPNSTYTTSMKQKKMNKLLWLRPWMSDMIIILKRWNVLFLELKRPLGKRWGLNGSKIADTQLEWQIEINKCVWVQYEFAHWFNDAKNIINKLENA